VDKLKDLKLDATNAPNNQNTPQQNTSVNDQHVSSNQQIPQTQPPAQETAEPAPPPPPPVMTVSQDPRYVGHFRLLKMV
jgi:hypothetical protein